MTTNKKSFTELFYKYTPDATDAVTISGIKDFTYSLNKEHRYIKINASFDELVSKKDIVNLENNLRNVYELNYCRIYTIYPLSLFESYIAKDKNGQKLLFNEIIDELKRDYAFINGFFDDAEPTFGSNTLHIELKPGLDKLPKLSDCEREIENSIRREFSADIKVTVSAPEMNSDAYEKEIAEFYKNNPPAEAYNEQKTEVKSEQIQATVNNEMAKSEIIKGDDESLKIASGYYTYDISSPEILFGTKIGENTLSHILSPGELTRPLDNVSVCGTVFFAEGKESKSGDRISYTIRITDDVGSVTIKLRGKIEKLDAFSGLKPGAHLLVNGQYKYDEYEKDFVISPKSVYKINRIEKTDTAEEKRVELHLHTQMSSMDATIPPDVIVKTAYKWGHRAVAITDHGNLQAFPEAMLAYEKLGADPEKFKIIYGMEGYFVDDTARASYGKKNADFINDEFVIFEIETTGLSPATCGIHSRAYRG